MSDATPQPTPDRGWVRAMDGRAALSAGRVPHYASGQPTQAADAPRPAGSGVLHWAQDDHIPPSPRMTASVAALLARPLPALDLPPVDDGTEDDLIRLCAVAMMIHRHHADLALVGSTLYQPPHGVSGRLAELDRRLSLAYGAISSIRARTPAGLRAKAKLIAASGSGRTDISLDSQPMVRSLLADCAYLSA